MESGRYYYGEDLSASSSSSDSDDGERVTHRLCVKFGCGEVENGGVERFLSRVEDKDEWVMEEEGGFVTLEKCGSRVELEVLEAVIKGNMIGCEGEVMLFGMKGDAIKASAETNKDPKFHEMKSIQTLNGQIRRDNDEYMGTAGEKKHKLCVKGGER